MQDEQKLYDFLFNAGSPKNDTFWGVNGQRSSIEAFIRLHEDNLYGLCRSLAKNRQDADDLYQQTWLKAIQKAQTIKHKSFRNWLYTICINSYRDQCRKAKRREKVTNDKMDESAKEYAISSASDGVSAENIAIENYTRGLLVEKINQLPEKQRLPIMLYYFEDMDYNECANVLKVPVGTIKSRLSNAKKRLQEEMEKNLSV